MYELSAKVHNTFGTKQTDIRIVMDYITCIHTNTVPLTFVYVKYHIQNVLRIM